MPVDHLLADVCRRPYAKEPRLELIRALKRRSDPRAALVSRQLEAERLGIGDPVWPEATAHALEETLVQGKRWFSNHTNQTWSDADGHFGHLVRPTPIFGPWLAGDDYWLLGGGVPESVSIRAEQLLESASKIRETAPLRDLVLFGVYSRQLVENRKAHRSECAELMAPPSILQSLDEEISRLGNRPPIGDVLSTSVFCGLRSLFVRGLHDQEFSVLVDSPACRNLEGLTVEFVGGSSTAAFEKLANSPGLQSVLSLSLNGNGCDVIDIDDAGCIALGASMSFPILRRLTLRCLSLGINGIEAILGAASLPKVDEVDFAWNACSADTLARISRHPRGTTLKLLNLAGCFDALRFNRGEKIGFADVDWNRFGSLRHLDLSYSPLSDADVRAIASAESLKNLQELNISHCEVSDAGMCSILESETLSSLVSLDVSGNDISVNALESLSSSSLAVRIRRLMLPKFAEFDKTVTEMERIVRILALAPFVNLIQLGFDHGHWTGDHDDPPIRDGDARILTSSSHLPWLSYLQAVCTPEARSILRDRWGRRLTIYDAVCGPVYP